MTNDNDSPQLHKGARAPRLYEARAYPDTPISLSPGRWLDPARQKAIRREVEEQLLLDQAKTVVAAQQIELASRLTRFGVQRFVEDSEVFKQILLDCMAAGDYDIAEAVNRLLAGVPERYQRILETGAS